MAEKPNELRFGPIPSHARHICVDMQRMFAEATDWNTPWMDAVVPNVARLTDAMAERTIFTRFIPPRTADETEGTWRAYYRVWSSMTLARLPPGMIDLMPELARFVPPAVIVDKQVYSPWYRSALPALLEREGADTLLITGGETDVCVLATVMGAIDRGYRVIVVTDALCSSADETHDASMVLYLNRFGIQVETATTEVVLEALGR